MKLHFQRITPRAGRWPDWLHALGKSSGVYVIRTDILGRILYVGESHSGRLKLTLQRHFWPWTGKTAGVTYDASDVEVAVVKTPAARAVPLQNQLIKKLDPRDNILENGDENPF